MRVLVLGASASFALAMAPVAAAATGFATGGGTNPTPTPAAVPTPTPTPVPSIFLNPTSAPAGAQVNLGGTNFPPDGSFNVSFDGIIITTVQSDTAGSIASTAILVPNSVTPGEHSICVEVQQGVNVCFQHFVVEAAVTASPSPSPSATPSPTSSPTVGAAAPTTSGGGVSPLGLLTRPPFVFLPILAVVGLLGFLALWAWRTRAAPPLGEVTFEHLSPTPRAYEPAPAPAAPTPAEPPVKPSIYEHPVDAPAPPLAPPPSPPSGADVPPDLPEASD